MEEKTVVPFSESLVESGLELRRDNTTTIQINIGLKCNLECKHCHVEAGPTRTEAMDEKTVRQVAEYVKRARFDTVDITGGAPEMNKQLPLLISLVRPLVKTIMVRTNLILLAKDSFDRLIDTFVENQVVLIASLPSLSTSQTDAQRGDGIFDKSILAIKKLNKRGYGREGSGLVLDIAANPTGAFMAPSQESVQARYRKELKRRYEIEFNNLFVFANVPVGRFENWLKESGNFDGYFRKLAESFNPLALSGVMCRYQVSVDWDGYMYDCDFHLAKQLPLGGTVTHVSEMKTRPAKNEHIATSDYCYTCTAGAGFTCGGAID